MTDDLNPKDRIAASKVDLSLVPPASIIHEAMAMENGAKKYNAYNWREKKVRARVYIAAALRHLLEYLDGGEFSGDTQPPVHHLAHAKACCGILLDALETGNLVDDRPITHTNPAARLLAPRVEAGLGVSGVGVVREPRSVTSEYDAKAIAMDKIAERRRGLP